MIAALYIMERGVYANRPDVDCWGVSRDARLYPGPWPVVAHPPCERWGRYWSGGPSAKTRRMKGDDGGCFAAAISAVRKWGGVLEHPEGSAAWNAFQLLQPPKAGGWIMAGDGVGFTCCVEQGHYGHRARKATWLYAVGIDLPKLIWGKCRGKLKLEDGCHSAEDRKRRIKAGITEHLSHRERAATPEGFAELLISMAMTVRGAKQ